MATIKGVIDTEIFTTDDGFVAIQQTNRNDGVTSVLLSPDQLPAVIDTLRDYHQHRRQWQEPTRG
jgi:hypothetical protein